MTENLQIISNKPFEVSALQPCNNSEADKRIFLHLAYATGQGRQTVYVRTVESDVVVLAIYATPNSWTLIALGGFR